MSPHFPISLSLHVFIADGSMVGLQGNPSVCVQLLHGLGITTIALLMKRYKMLRMNYERATDIIIITSYN
jgi:hypothetical protein